MQNGIICLKKYRHSSNPGQNPDLQRRVVFDYREGGFAESGESPHAILAHAFTPCQPFSPIVNKVIVKCIKVMIELQTQKS
jgi:hypothetical protein